MLQVLTHLNYNILSRLNSFRRIDAQDEELNDSPEEIFRVCSHFHYCYKQNQENNIGSTVGNRIPIFSVRALIDYSNKNKRTNKQKTEKTNKQKP